MTIRKIVSTPSANYYPLLIKNLLSAPLIYSPDREIVYSDKARYNYKTLYKRICQLAHALKKAGVKEGDIVAIMDFDGNRYLECLFAVPMIGAVLHTVHNRLTPDQILYTINHAEDDILLINSELLPIYESIKDQIKTVKKIILLTDDNPTPKTAINFIGEYENMIGQESSEYDFQEFDEDAMATLFYTSGNTGSPKGVYYSHRQIVLHAYGTMSSLCAYKSQVSVDSEDVYMPLTPMFHVHAWGFPYFFTLLGAKQVYPGKFRADKIIELIQKEKITISHCVPTVLHMLLNNPLTDDVDLSHLKLIIGGSKLSESLCKAALDRNINLFAAYGMSETGPLITLSRLKPEMFDWDEEKQIEIRCRTGLPTPMVDVDIVDPEGNKMPHDGMSVGEIVVKSPWLTQGYHKENEKSEELWENGKLHTGDIGYIDENGYVQITDRIKEVIKSGGEWISALELEDAISEHPDVKEVSVIGIHDEKWGEKPCAHIILEEEAKDKITIDDIKSHIMKYVEKGTLPKYIMNSTIVFVDIIPKTGVGKISKKHMMNQNLF